MILPILRKWQKCLNVAFSNINLTGNRGKILKIFFRNRTVLYSDVDTFRYNFRKVFVCNTKFFVAVFSRIFFSSTETYFPFGDMSVLWS